MNKQSLLAAFAFIGTICLAPGQASAGFWHFGDGVTDQIEEAIENGQINPPGHLTGERLACSDLKNSDEACAEHDTSWLYQNWWAQFLTLTR